MTWQPLERSIPIHNGVESDIKDEEQWANDQYIVFRRVVKSENSEVADAIHLSIKNRDRSPRHDWRDFQRIKNQLAGPEWEGIEIYPAENRLVDMANQYHLWCFPFTLGIGFDKRRVGNQAQADLLTPGAKQRDFEPVDLQYGGLSRLKDMKQDLDDYGKPKEADT